MSNNKRIAFILEEPFIDWHGAEHSNSAGALQQPLGEKGLPQPARLGNFREQERISCPDLWPQHSGL